MPRNTYPVWIVLSDNCAEREDRTNEGALEQSVLEGDSSEMGGAETNQQDSAPARLDVGIFFGREDTKDIVVLVNRLTVVSAFLRVPPVAH